MQRSAETSPFYARWIEQQDADMDIARDAVRDRDFEKLAEIAEHNCLKMHSVTWTSRPPVVYWNTATLACMQAVRDLRAAGETVFFTIDAGPQVKAVCLPGSVEAVAAALGDIPGVVQIMRSGLGTERDWQALRSRIMAVLTVSAPGKALISGEYAVLAGAWALSMALNRRAVVSINDDPASGVHTVRAPGFADSAIRFRVSPDGLFEWLDELPSPDTHGLLEQVWRRSGITSRHGLSIAIDSRAFVDEGTGRKLGIGSSAAVAVALAGAFRELGALSESTYEIAMDAHRSFQGGSGSGVDVATSCYGGTIGYRLHSAPRVVGFPHDLRYRYFWSGVPASTAGKISQLATDSSSSADSALAVASEQVFEQALTNDAEGFLREMKNFADTLAEYDREHRLGIFSAGHRVLAEEVQSARDIVYKPCGAGGGDIGVAMATSAAALEAFTLSATRRGFVMLDAILEPRGVLVEAA